MKIAQPYRVFQLPERGFDTPPGIVDFFEQLRREFVGRKDRDKAFVSIVRESEPDHAERIIVTSKNVPFSLYMRWPSHSVTVALFLRHDGLKTPCKWPCRAEIYTVENAFKPGQSRMTSLGRRAALSKVTFVVYYTLMV